VIVGGPGPELLQVADDLHRLAGPRVAVGPELFGRRRRRRRAAALKKEPGERSDDDQTQ